MVIARRSRAAVVLSVLVSGVVLSSSAVSAGSRSADRRYQGRNGHHGHGTGPEADPRGKRALRRTRAQGGRIARRQGRNGDRHRTRRHEVRDVYSHARRRKPGLRARPAYGGGSCVGPGRSSGWRSRSLAAQHGRSSRTAASARSATRGPSSITATTSTSSPTTAPAYDWYALQRYGTAHPQLTVGARPRTDPSVSKRRLVPVMGGLESASRLVWSNCSTTSIGISTPVGGISKSFERCPDQVTFKKSANGTQPDYTQTWFGLGTRGNRELNFEIAVRVTQGGGAAPSRCRPLSREARTGDADARPDPAHGNGCTPACSVGAPPAGDPESKHTDCLIKS